MISSTSSFFQVTLMSVTAFFSLPFSGGFWILGIKRTAIGIVFDADRVDRADQKIAGESLIVSHWQMPAVIPLSGAP